jgi:predicted PurR-regulated permease PerM
MKNQMGLNPAIIFLSLSLWVYVLGFIGLIIGLPLTTLIISYYCEFVLHQPNPLHKSKKKLLNDKKTPISMTSSFIAKYKN